MEKDNRRRRGFRLRFENQPFRRVPSAELNQTLDAPSTVVFHSLAEIRSGRNVIKDSSQRNPYTKAAHPSTSDTATPIRRSLLKIFRVVNTSTITISGISRVSRG